MNFEGPWNNYGQSKFKEAWKQIVHVFDEEEVKNVAYVWQSAGLNRSDIEKWYPGDEYVNWLGYSHFDGFNMGQSMLDFAEEHDKPVMIAEATPRRQLKTGSPENHWRSWFAPLFERSMAMTASKHWPISMRIGNHKACGSVRVGEIQGCRKWNYQTGLDV